MKKVLVFLFVLLWAVPVSAVQILATVQDEIITDLDVQERAELVEKMFKASMNDALKKDVLEDLINEKVKLLTAKKHGIVVSEEQISEGISFLEKQNQMSSGDLEKFISENELSFDSLKSQIVADLMWLRFVQEQNLSRPDVSDKKVDAELQKMRESLSKASYLLAEIYIPFDGNEVAAEQQINMLFNRIIGGESFTDLAKEFSKGKTANLMGDLGWVAEGQMEPAVDAVLPYIQTMQLSKPIKGKDGFYLILMREKRAALDSDMQEFVQISQLILKEQDYSVLKNDLDNASSSCMAFTQFAMQNGVAGSNSGAMPEVMLAQLPFDMQQLLKDKNLNELVGPLKMTPYLLFVMKCGSKVKSVLPEKENIREQLQAVEMEKILSDLLKKQREKMVVEIK